MLFVLSVNRIWNMAWYMLNQLTLDRGPDDFLWYPSEFCSQTNQNCWAAGNAGEIDFLESAWTVNSSAADEYRRLFNAQWNQVCSYTHESLFFPTCFLICKRRISCRLGEAFLAAWAPPAMQTPVGSTTENAPTTTSSVPTRTTPTPSRSFLQQSWTVSAHSSIVFQVHIHSFT